MISRILLQLLHCYIITCTYVKYLILRDILILLVISPFINCEEIYW